MDSKQANIIILEKYTIFHLSTSWKKRFWLFFIHSRLSKYFSVYYFYCVDFWYKNNPEFIDTVLFSESAFPWVGGKEVLFAFLASITIWLKVFFHWKY